MPGRAEGTQRCSGTLPGTDTEWNLFNLKLSIELYLIMVCTLMVTAAVGLCWVLGARTPQSSNDFTSTLHDVNPSSESARVLLRSWQSMMPGERRSWRQLRAWQPAAEDKLKVAEFPETSSIISAACCSCCPALRKPSCRVLTIV